MSKILREGSLPEDKLMRGTCYRCGCYLECKQGETKQSINRNDTDYEIACPTVGCNSKIFAEFVKTTDQYGD